MVARLPASKFKKAMGCNGLAKFRGRLKEPSFQTAQKQAA